VRRVLEIAASTRVLRERRFRALEATPGGALLGREFANLRGLAERCAAETGVAVHALLDGGALARLVSVCAASHPRFRELVAGRPGTAAALAGTLRDLRDSGLAPRALPDEAAELRALYTDVDRALARLETEGLFDRIGLFRLAARGAAAFVERLGIERVEIHGATELVGSAGDLLDALATALPAGAVRFFQPDWGDPHGERLRAEWTWPRFAPEPVEIVDQPALVRDGDVPEGALRVLRAASPREEVERVAREVLALLERGVPPHEIALVARALEPFAPWLETAFDGYGIPVSASLAQPAIGAPAARTWLDLLHALTRDLERAPLVRLLDHACVRAVGAAAEKIGRMCAVVRGEADWRAALANARYAHERALLQGPLERLFAARRALAGATSFAAGARVLLDAGAVFLPDSADDPAGASAECRAVLERVALLDRVEAAAGVRGAPDAAALAHALESALLEPSVAWRAEDRGGVRVLDAAQARALPFRHLFLIGVVHGAWPRELPDDPFLPERVRARLRSELRRPVPLRRLAAAEDRSLFGLLLAQARDEVVISFAERDGQGRALSPSALLRALPFVAPGTDVLAREPAPLADDAGFARAPAAPLANGDAILAAGRAQLELTSDAASADLRFDGAVGAEALPELPALSPTFVEGLGRCALRAYFQHVLRARELEQPGPAGLDASDSGSFVHAVLHSLYAALESEGCLRPGASALRARERADALLPRALEEAAPRVRGDLQARHPGIWQAYLDSVGRAIGDFLDRDLAALLPDGVARIETERDVHARLELGSGASLEIEGRIDRIVERPDGSLRVGDYKTGRSLRGKPVAPPEVSKGRSLQVPLYALALARERDSDAVVGEVLPVPLHPARDRDELRAEERSLALDQIRSLAARPLEEVAGLLARGEFPFREREFECRHCPYTIACRYAHAESDARSRATPSRHGYYALDESGT